MKLIIEDDEGHKTTVPFVREEITVGRQDGNTIRLTERNVSRKHARFYRKSGGVFVEDLQSHNGIKVNGDRIEAAIALKEGDLVQIGDYDLAVQDEQLATKPPDNRATVKMEALEDLPSGEGAELDGATSRNVGRDARSKSSSLLPDIEADPAKPAASRSAVADTAVVNLNGAAEREVSAPAPAPPGVDISPDEAPHLVMVSTELAGREFACIRSVLTIGRGDECDIPIDHRSLSREHARLERRGSQWHVVDLGSPNRVQVNGEEYADTTVGSGDIITLGHVKLRFVAPGEEFTYVPDGGRKRSPVVFIMAGLAAVGVVGAGVYFGVIRKGGGPVEPSPLENPKAPAPPPPLIPKAEATTPEPKTPPPTVAATEPPKEVAPPPPKLVETKTPEAPKPPDEVVVPDTAPTPDLKAPEPKAAPHHDEPHKLEKPIPHSKADPHAKPDKGPAAVAAAEPAGPTPQDQANDLRNDANDLMRQGLYDRAMTKLRQALVLTPKDAQLHKSLGSCLANSGEMDEAAKEYQRFIDLAPNSPDVSKVKALLDAYHQQAKGGN